MEQLFTPVENEVSSLMDDIAVTLFKRLSTVESITATICNGESYKDLANGIAKISFDFADAFMRERYERNSVKATGINLNDLISK